VRPGFYGYVTRSNKQMTLKLHLWVSCHRGFYLSKIKIEHQINTGSSSFVLLSKDCELEASAPGWISSASAALTVAPIEI
jgi:hypothetical protein